MKNESSGAHLSTDNDSVLSGRLPLRGDERVFEKYVPFMWTCTSFAAATWAFLIGGVLPFIGDTKLGILGYFVGTLIGLVPVIISGGLPSFKYGVDPIDGCKSAFGVRGALFPLMVLVVVNLCWSYVLVALTSRGVANIYQTVAGDPISEAVVVVVGLGVLVLGWVMSLFGPRLFERINNYVAPGHMIVTLIMLFILCSAFGLPELFSANVPPEKAFTQDKLLGFVYAVEFGVSACLSWWPMVGGLTRLVKNRKHVTGPMVWGLGVLGAAFISAIAAMAAVTAGTADPTVWFIQLGGPYLGVAMMTFVMVCNIPSMVLMLYLAGVSIQQIKFFASLRWPVLMGIFMLPGIFVAFNTQWILDEVMALTSYVGLLSIGIASVMLVDYVLLRREHLDVRYLFCRQKGGLYWFYGGVNWAAIATTFAAIAFYLWLYNPSTLETQPMFRYFGAGVPTMLFSCALYYTLMRLFVVSRTGGYRATSLVTRNTPVEVSL